MIKIEAYIKAHRLDGVVELLHSIDGLTGVSIHEIKGYGRDRGQKESVRIADNTVSWVPHVKIEIFCSDAIKELVVKAIFEGAHTGLRGDGKIYLSKIDDALRISTDERGGKAV